MDDVRAAAETVSDYMSQARDVLAKCAQDPRAAGFIVEAAQLLRNTFQAGNKLFTAGNGGSFADATHVAAEFVGRLRVERPPISALALGTNGSSWSAIANDYEAKSVFARELSALAKPGDVLIVFSTSGRSPNILELLEVANCLDVVTLGFLGKSGRPCLDLCHRAYVVESNVTEFIQGAHITMAHALCATVDAYLGFDSDFLGSTA